MLSPHEVRSEEGWPASSDPTADSIEPPISGDKAADQQDDPPAPAPPPPTDDEKVSATIEGAMAAIELAA